MIVRADARRIPLPDESVQCVVTSPPYWGLRKYKGDQDLIWAAGLSEANRSQTNVCAHEWTETVRQGISGADGKGNEFGYRVSQIVPSSVQALCARCGAWRGGFGLEPTVEMYVAHTVEILREIRRVLRHDGVVFWNIGDSYSGGQSRGKTEPSGKQQTNHGTDWFCGNGRGEAAPGLKPKDLCLIPARVALAAQQDSWWVRSLIIWAKPNPMPESVTDRPTDAYEHILMLTKSERYFWDAEAVKEPSVEPDRIRADQFGGNKGIEVNHSPGSISNGHGSRNLRNVWTFPTQAYSGAHFATFPEEIPRRAILAATSARGACVRCGSPWKRIVESNVRFEGGSGRAMSRDPESWNGSKFDIGKTAEHQGQRMQLRSGKYEASEQSESGDYDIRMGPVIETQTVGWEPTCECGVEETAACLVLDPFGGSGTTGRVAIELNRRAVLLDLAYSADAYAPLAQERLRDVQREMFA